MELGLQVASLGADGGPGTLRQGCLEPRGTFAQAGGAALAGAFVVARAATGPGEQMAGGGEAAHVEPDFREDDLPAQVTDAGDRAQLADGVAERAEVALHLGVDLGDGGVQSVDLPEVQAQQEAVTVGDASL